MPGLSLFLPLRGLPQFPSILEALQARVIRLDNPDPSFPFGTSGDDLIEPINQGIAENFFGNSGDDIIYGMGGADTIQGDSDSFRDPKIPSNFSNITYGDDIIFGDDGDKDGDLFDSRFGAGPFDDDNIYAGLGHDWVFGESGNDVIYGGPERGDFADIYVVNARKDDDHLYGGVGDDFLVGGYGKDFLVGGRGNDELIGSSRRGGQHQWDGIDVLWGDEENGDGSSGADTFILGERGERYYDDNYISSISSISEGRGHYALIRDFNPNRGDKIQLAALPASGGSGFRPQYHTKFTTPARIGLNLASDPNALGTAIYYDSDPRPFNSEIIAFVEGDTLLSLDSSSVIYS